MIASHLLYLVSTRCLELALKIVSSFMSLEIFCIFGFSSGKHIKCFCHCFWLLDLNFVMDCFLRALFSIWTVKISVFDLACGFCGFHLAFLLCGQCVGGFFLWFRTSFLNDPCFVKSLISQRSLDILPTMPICSQVRYHPLLAKCTPCVWKQVQKMLLHIFQVPFFALSASQFPET